MPSPWAAIKLRMPHPRDWQREQIPRGCPGGGEVGTAGIDWCITILEWGSGRHRGRVSRSWSISDFFKFRLCWSVFDFDFSDALFNFLLAQSVLLTSDQWNYLIFLPGEGALPVLWSTEIPNLTPMCACLGHKYANYALKVKNTEDHQISSKWKPKSQILNNTWAVYCLLNQRTQTLIQIVIHTMTTYAFVDQNLFSLLFYFKNVMWQVVENAAELIYREKNSLQNSRCHKSKRLSIFIIFIPL